MAHLEASHICVDYAQQRSDIPLSAVENLSFRAEDGEFVVVVGPSGCGKTTLLRVIAGLIQPTGGTIAFKGWSGSDNPPRRSLVFQEQGLFPWMTVLDNTSFGLEMQAVSRARSHEQAMHFLEMMGIDEFAHSYPHELSGGMRQRVAIARAFVSDAPILLMDEPFRALDAQTRLVLQEELLRIWQERHKLVIYITHDIDEAILLGDRVLVMSGRPGHFREEIPVPFSRPRDLTGRAYPELKEMEWRIWKMLESQTRQNIAKGN